MRHNIKDIVYAPETIEFVTVAVEYCIFMESFKGLSRQEFTSKLTKVLPLLYLKAQMVPDIQNEDFDNIENAVTEDDYNFILHRATAIMGEYNDYLEVFVEDIKYSPEPILAHVAENLADIYQDLRNFVAVYERGIEEHMYEALQTCMDDFKSYWGQTLVNVLRALHSITYTPENSLIEDHEADYNEPNFEDEW